LIIEILGPAIVVGAAHELKPLSETLPKPDSWPSSAVHSLVTSRHYFQRALMVGQPTLSIKRHLSNE